MYTNNCDCDIKHNDFDLIKKNGKGKDCSKNKKKKLV